MTKPSFFIAKCVFLLGCISALLMGSPTYAAPSHNRILVLTDIGNEPDDQMSVVRLLTYANELEIEGLVATTSTWQRNHVQPETIRKLIKAYGQVRPNLVKHADHWPTANSLLSRVVSGQLGYGMEFVGKDKSTAGSQFIIEAAEKEDPRPLWISVWGGANTLAQALWDLRATRTPEQVEKIIANLRIYSISDQDDAGAWIRKEFPNLYYIVTPSSQDNEDYYYATWTGIAGDTFYRNGAGADSELITNAWLEKHIRKGGLGQHYPLVEYIMEGDTPAFLHLVNNGLHSSESPAWGGWGGRYILRQPRGESRPIWTQGGGGPITSQDEMIGIDGKAHVSDQATIWRWRRDFQQDFAARIRWTQTPIYNEANHHPIVSIKGYCNNAPIELNLKRGEQIQLDANQSRDPDGDSLTFSWFIYREAGTPSAQRASISLHNVNSPLLTIRESSSCVEAKDNRVCPKGTTHIILKVTDNGQPALTRYRRIILTSNEVEL